MEPYTVFLKETPAKRTERVAVNPFLPFDTMVI